MALTQKESQDSTRAIQRRTRKLLEDAKLKAQDKDFRFRYLYDLRDKYQSGEINIDLDDPRTTYGLTKDEVDFITEDSDQLYEEWRDARERGTA